MRDNVVESPPYGDRSSTGVTPEGGLDVRRIEFFGTWRGLGQRRTLNDLNQSPGANGISLFTPTYGSATPAQPGVAEIVLAPFPPTAPNADLTGSVVHIASGGGTAIPRDGAVLVARGTAAQRLLEESPLGTQLTLRLIFRPEWTGVTNAVGGGPVLVRNRGPVFRAQEAFTSSQLAPRNPRTGVGQLADGRVLMVVTDGRRPGYSVGMTNFELAQTMVRLGAVTGSAFDGGGSSSLAFDGKLLNRPSDRGGERSVSNALQLMYYGVYAPTPDAVISPNGDGFAERQRELTYKVVRPSDVTATLVAPGGASRLHRDAPAAAGDVPGRLPARSPPIDRGAGRRPLAPRRHGHRRPRTHVDDEPEVHGQQHARLRAALAPLARRPRPRQADDRGRCDADARGAGDRDRRDEDGREGCHDRRAPAPGRDASRPAGAERPAAASSSSTAACTSSASAPRTSSAPSSSSRRRSASSARRRCRRRSRSNRPANLCACRSPRSSRRSPISSRPSSATTASTPSSS